MVDNEKKINLLDAFDDVIRGKEPEQKKKETTEEDSEEEINDPLDFI